MYNLKKSLNMNFWALALATRLTNIVIVAQGFLVTMFLFQNKAKYINFDNPGNLTNL